MRLSIHFMFLIILQFGTINILSLFIPFDSSLEHKETILSNSSRIPLEDEEIYNPPPILKEDQYPIILPHNYSEKDASKNLLKCLNYIKKHRKYIYYIKHELWIKTPKQTTEIRINDLKICNPNL